MTDQYQYDYLDPGWIRLLHIVSVSPEIVFHVEKVSLASNPSYYALSYCWGDPPSSSRVYVDKGCLNVRPNLHNAVGKLGDYVGKRIWIDALSINQEDDEEKAHQVQAMDRVYRQAHTVLIWLGPEAEESDNAIKGICTYGKEALDAGILAPTFQQPESWSDPSPDPTLGPIQNGLLRLMQKARDSEGDPSRVEDQFPRLAFAKLSHRDYFSRVWVKQEVTLARKAIVLCGSQSTDLECLHATILFYGMLRPWEVLEWRAGRSMRIPGPFSEAELFAAEDPRVLLASTDTGEAIDSMVSGRHRYSRNGPGHMYKLIYQSYVKQSSQVLCCKDPRDKIWGLAGIASDMKELGLKVSYKKTIEDVYEDTTRALLRQGNVEILTLCRLRHLQSPTWVPNFDGLTRPPWSHDVGIPLFKACGDTTHPLVESSPIMPRRIHLRGVSVDTINEVGLTWRADANKSFDQEEFLAVAGSISEFLTNSKYPEDQRNIAQWQIPIGGKELPELSPYIVRSTERSEKQYHSLVSGPMDSEMMATTLSYQACMARMHMAKPLLTRDGYVGLGPSEMQVEDIVVIFYGASTPHVLRRGLSGEEAYILVGEAYIYGIMDGEFISHSETNKVYELW